MALGGIIFWFGCAAVCYLMATVNMAHSGVSGGWAFFAYGGLGILAAFLFFFGLACFGAAVDDL